MERKPSDGHVQEIQFSGHFTGTCPNLGHVRKRVDAVDMSARCVDDFRFLRHILPALRWAAADVTSHLVI